MDLSSNSSSLNNHGIPFLWTSSRNFHYSSVEIRGRVGEKRRD